MIQCRTCKAVSYPGSLFCQECGDILSNPSAVNQAERSLPGSVIHFLISTSGRQGELDCKETVWVGRSDPEQGYWPQLDLTSDGAVELGVSRRHALIRLEDQGPVLIDQNSVNGTWIDHVQLVPEKVYPLPRVAQIRFGRLQLRTFLE